MISKPPQDPDIFAFEDEDTTSNRFDFQVLQKSEGIIEIQPGDSEKEEDTTLTRPSVPWRWRTTFGILPIPIWVETSTLIAIASLLIVLPMEPESHLLFPLRLGIAAMFLCFLPGYWLLGGLLPEVGVLRPLERFVFSYGVSIGHLPAVALAFDQFGIPITMSTIMAFEVPFNLFLASVATYRRIQNPTAYRLPIFNLFKSSLWQALRSRKLHVDQIALAIYILLTITMTLGLSSAAFILSQQSRSPMTEFYLLNRFEEVGDLPNNLMHDQSLKVYLVTANREESAHEYVIAAYMNDELYWESQSIYLSPGEVQREPLIFTFDHLDPGSLVQVHLTLYKDENVHPYRFLRLWLHIDEAAS